jgi:hypothetical protein
MKIPLTVDLSPDDLQAAFTSAAENYGDDVTIDLIVDVIRGTGHDLGFSLSVLVALLLRELKSSEEEFGRLFTEQLNPTGHPERDRYIAQGVEFELKTADEIRSLLDALRQSDVLCSSLNVREGKLLHQQQQ